MLPKGLVKWTAKAAGRTTILLSGFGSVKHEDVYLRVYSSIEESGRGLCEYFKFYNEKGWHQNFDRKTPGTVHLQSLAQKQAVA
jgi:hypothetical protein